MNAGLLNEIIRILKPETIINEYGERKENFNVSYITRARVMNDSGSRSVENNEIVYGYSKTFNIRSYVPVNENCMIEWQNRTYRIITIEKRREFNDIMVKTELVNE